MVLPLVPIVASACGSTLAAASGYCLIKYEEMGNRLELVNAHTNSLQRAMENKSSVFSDLLEPLAKRWGGAVKVFAYSVAAASTALIVIGVGAWHEMRELRLGRSDDDNRALRAEIAALREENATLRRLVRNLDAAANAAG